MFSHKFPYSSAQSPVMSAQSPVMFAQSMVPASEAPIKQKGPIGELCLQDRANLDSPKNTNTIQSCISPWLTPIVYPLLRHSVVPAFFGTITITGQEHLPKSGPIILAPTHRSRWDALITPYVAGRHVTGRDLRFMVSADEMTGLQGWFIRQLGGFPVNPRQPAIASLRFGVDILKNHETMVIFPEGAIFRDRHIHPLRPGLARLAIQAETSIQSENNEPGLGVRIVPMDLHYSDPIPHWGTDVNVKIGKPLVVSDYCVGSMTAKARAKTLTTELSQSLEDLL